MDAKSYYEADYKPSTGLTTDQRIANAAEYIAYQLGQINQKLTKIAENSEKKDG